MTNDNVNVLGNIEALKNAISTTYFKEYPELQQLLNMGKYDFLSKCESVTPPKMAAQLASLAQTRKDTTLISKLEEAVTKSLPDDHSRIDEVRFDYFKRLEEYLTLIECISPIHSSFKPETLAASVVAIGLTFHGLAWNYMPDLECKYESFIDHDCWKPGPDDYRVVGLGKASEHIDYVLQLYQRITKFVQNAVDSCTANYPDYCANHPLELRNIKDAIGNEFTKITLNRMIDWFNSEAGSSYQKRLL